MQAGRITADLLASTEYHHTDNQEQRNRCHFDQRKPELHFGKPLHADYVHGADNRQRTEGKHPLWDIAERAPVVHVERDGGDVHNAGHRPVEEVHPASHIRGFLAVELTSIGDETAAGWAVQHQFAQCTEDEERENTAHRIHNRQCRTVYLYTRASTEK